MAIIVAGIDEGREGFEQLIIALIRRLVTSELLYIQSSLLDGHPDLPDPVLEDILYHVQQMRVHTFLSLITNGADSADPPQIPAGEEGAINDNARRLPAERGLVTAGADGEPPPTPGDYSEVVPDNLENIHWDCGDSIRFYPVVTALDDNGMKRRFYSATYEFCNQHGDLESVNLSHYSGKPVLFEGTKGSISGASLTSEERERCGGWAVDGYFSTVRDANLVALNGEHLAARPENISLVFHELGHIYLFGDPQRELFGGTPKKDRFMRFLSRSEDAGAKLRGIGNYQMEVRDVREGVRDELQRHEAALSDTSALKLLLRSAANGFTRNSQELLIRQQSVDRAEDLAYFLRMFQAGSAISDKDFYMLKAGLPELSKLVSVFHERYTSAYGIRQIRTLRPKHVSERSALEYQRASLKYYSIERNDMRYVKGV
jgi:hypothetical protein